MSQIVVESLEKRFQVAERNAGFIGALKGLFQRRYREVRALAGIDFSIDAGELVGYIGPNGAGKSTTVKILSGILTPTSGICRVNGLVPWIDRMQHVANIGVVFGQRTQLWWDLPVIESFDLLRDIYRIKPADYVRSRDQLVARCWIPRCGSCPSGSACGATWWPRCCTVPPSCSWMNPPLALTPYRSSRCVTSSRP